MDLQTPSVLAQLPHPLHASTGNTHIAEVHSLADSKKRKRYEVVVAVDGEAVNIYNIQTPKLVTSYAVPPQSSFSCQPCSLRNKSSSGSAVKRHTYVAVKQQLKSFHEESGGAGSGAPIISSSSFSVDDISSPTVFIGIVPADGIVEEGKESFDVLAVHSDGHTRRLSSDLGTQRWSIQHSEISRGGLAQDIQSCFLLDFDDARKCLFKRRPDLISLALGDLTNLGAGEPSILMLVSYPTGPGKITLNQVNVQVFSVPACIPSWNKNLDESQKMRHLLTFTLPDIGEEYAFDRGGLRWYFHAGSAGLSFSFDKGFMNFDLSHYTPLVTTKFILESENFSSVIRITPQSVMGAGKSVIALYDTQYKSVHRSIATQDLPASGSSASGKPGAGTKFISYFSKLDVVVATNGNKLLAFDVGSSQTTPGSSLKRSRDGLLVDAIGRGIGSSAAPWSSVSKKHRVDNLPTFGFPSSEKLDQWKELTHELSEFSKAKDGHAFDRAVRNYFGVGDSNILPAQGGYVNPEMALFLLSCVFHVNNDITGADRISASPSLRIYTKFWPHETCKWLTQLGYLYPGNVEAALRRSFTPRILPPLPTGSFIQAIKDSDPSLRRLIFVLQSPAVFSSDEIAHALKIFINMARSCSLPDEETTKALTNGESHDNPIPNGDSSPANNDVSTVTTEASLHAIFLGLNTTLQRIHAHPQPAITSGIRSILSRTEIISLIYHLRLSLATGGHTSRFTENPPTPITPELTIPPLSLNTIIDTLNAAVDAIGPSGWISAADFSDSAPRDMDLIAEMKSEVSAALEGVQEATHLKGILREYLRYANSATSTDTGLENSLQMDNPVPTSVRYEKLNGADLLVFGTKGEEDDNGDASGKLLPLSLKANSDVSKTKVNKTGQIVRRSKREIGYLRGKAAGKYTFERLIL